MLIILLKVLILYALILEINSYFSQNINLIIFLIFISYHSLSRLSAINVVFTSGYSRADDQSKSKPVAKNNTYIEIIIAYFWGITPFIFLCFFNLQYLPIPPIIWLFSILSTRYFIKHLEGYTGDCLGAVEQLSELLCLFLYLGILSFQG